MDHQILLNQVENILGKSTPTGKGNYSFHCPFCKHYKKKLEINLIPNNKNETPYHCWVCEIKGKNIYSLFKKLNISKENLKKFEIFSIKSIQLPDSINKEIIKLPENFIPLYDRINKKDIIANQAIKYLYSRNINNNDIIKYNIGYCDEGSFKDMVVIPSYDNNMNLNYFVGRSFISNRKKNPPTQKNIIGLESFINFNLPIILCEGIFDALAIKRNAIPLFGKTIQPLLKEKLIHNKTNKIYVALDKDAMKTSLSQTKEFLDYGKEVYLVDLPKGTDPSALGFENFHKILQNTPKLTFNSFISYKLST